jgi:cytoplasmic iron level regulating protein YaaA (DUF328/UPF0246 family)
MVTRTGTFDHGLQLPRQQVIEAIRDLLTSGSRDQLEKAFNARGPLLDRALSASRLIIAGDAAQLPTWQRYSGVVWSHLDPVTLSVSQRRRILVPSGLYGITTGTDLVADYRLKMNVGLPSIGNLASFWRRNLAPTLEEFLQGATVVNLLPKEHAASLDLSWMSKHCRLTNISFFEHGGARAAGHDAKAVKGILARRALTENLAVLESFEWEGWRAHLHHHELRVIGPRARSKGFNDSST